MFTLILPQIVLDEHHPRHQHLHLLEILEQGVSEDRVALASVVAFSLETSSQPLVNSSTAMMQDFPMSNRARITHKTLPEWEVILRSTSPLDLVAAAVAAVQVPTITET
jgi:hypothetical protein